MDCLNTNVQLKEAAKEGNASSVFYLVTMNGANIDAKYEYGNTALIWAAINNRYAVTKKLIEMGADIYLENNLNKSALYFSVLKQHHKVSFLLFSEMSSETLTKLEKDDFFKDAVKYFNEKKQNKIVAKLSCLDVQNEKGETMLIAAARNGHLNTVNILISYGADIKKMDMHGYDALDWAKKNKHAEMVSLLSHTKDTQLNEMHENFNTLKISPKKEIDKDIKANCLVSPIPQLTIAYSTESTEIKSENRINKNLLYDPDIKKIRKKSTASPK